MKLFIEILVLFAVLQPILSFIAPPFKSISIEYSRSYLQRLKAISSFESCISRNPESVLALNELLTNARNLFQTNQDKKGIAFLFVGQSHTPFFPELIIRATHELGKQTQLVALVGGGVVGGGNEIDNTSLPAMSLLFGLLPSHSNINIFSFTEETSRSMESWKKELPSYNEGGGVASRLPSYLVFADPFSPIDKLLQCLDSSANGAVVAGGISVPITQNQGTVAMGGRVMPVGTAIVVAFSGNIGLQTVVAQGCRPVGPTFRVTLALANVMLKIDGKPPIQQIGEVVMKEADTEAKAIIQKGWLLGGVYPETMREEDPLLDGDFLIRQIVGYNSADGSLVIGGTIQEGDNFRFHIRSQKEATEDMKSMVARAKTERLFAGVGQAGKLLAAVQISCVARGQSLFDNPNADLQHIETLFDESSFDTSSKATPIAGFFANGEIGPVGTRIGGFAEKNSNNNNALSTHIHGFTAVVALLCDYSENSPALDDNSTTFDNNDSSWG